MMRNLFLEEYDKDDNDCAFQNSLLVLEIYKIHNMKI